jgi:23S rRNA G2445 N2-methylase RlmL
MRKMHGSSSDDARGYRQRGHDNALKFALAIGLPRDYQNDKKAKKDVMDPSGDAHSVKSGEKKWQK